MNPLAHPKYILLFYVTLFFPTIPSMTIKLSIKTQPMTRWTSSGSHFDGTSPPSFPFHSERLFWIAMNGLRLHADSFLYWWIFLPSGRSPERMIERRKLLIHMFSFTAANRSVHAFWLCYCFRFITLQSKQLFRQRSSCSYLRHMQRHSI